MKLKKVDFTWYCPFRKMEEMFNRALFREIFTKTSPSSLSLITSNHIPFVLYSISSPACCGDQPVMAAVMFTCAVDLVLFLDRSLNTHLAHRTGFNSRLHGSVLGLPTGLKWTAYFSLTRRATLHLQMLMAHSQPLMGTSCISMSARCLLSLCLPTYMII